MAKPAKRSTAEPAKGATAKPAKRAAAKPAKGATAKRAAAKPAKGATAKPAEHTTATRAATPPAPAAPAAPQAAPAAAAPAGAAKGRAVKPKRMSGWDFATWRTASDDPSLRSPIIGLVILDGTPDWDTLVERFDRASRVAPILRQRVIEGPADFVNPRLVVDPDFDLSFHLRRFAMPSGEWADVLDEVRRQSMTDFDLARPLWRVTLLEGLAGGRSALVVKLHHAIADGQGAVMLGATLVDFTPEGADLGPMPAEPVAVTVDQSGLVAIAVRDAGKILSRGTREAVEAAVPLLSRTLTDPVGVAEEVSRLVRSVARFVAVHSGPLSPLMVGRSINYHFVTFDLPLAGLKRTAKAHGMTLNDAFMAGVTGGLARYHEARGEHVDRLRVNMPISLRDPDRPASNAVTIARFEVPVGEGDLVARMRGIHETVARWRREPALRLADQLAEMSRLVPTEMLRAAAQNSDFTTSNVPGVPVPVWIAGAPVLRMYPMVSTIGAATNVTLLSYASLASVGVSTDDVAIKDRALFARCLADGFAEVVGEPVAPSDPLAAGAPAP